MRMVATVCAALLVMGCARTPRVNVDPEAGRVDVDVQRVGTGETWHGTLTATAATPAVSGSVTAHVTDDMTHAMVTLTGGAPGASHPWHIHEGTCGANGPVVGDAASYPPLRPGADGRAAAEAHLANLELNEAKRYYVNVHASSSNMGTIIACGALDD